MDPRHPELAVSRMRELMKQFDRIEKDMKATTVSNKLAQLEREGGLVIQEICLVAPRLHEAMIQTSRMRRQELSRQMSSLSKRELNKVYKNIRNDDKIEDVVSEKEFHSFMHDLQTNQTVDKESDNYAIVQKTQCETTEVTEVPKKKKTTKKKKTDFSKVEFWTYDEGLCVQCMHLGSYDDEPATVKAMQQHAEALGYEEDFESGRLHHEIYLSDPRRTDPAKLKTVVRHPIRKREEQ